MITRVDITSDKDGVLSLPLSDTSQGFTVADISGLDPVDSEITSSDYALQDGVVYHSSRRGARNIVLTLDLESTYSTDVSGLRALLYKYLMPGASLKIRIFDLSVGGMVDIKGVVETFECPLFSAEPRATISIMCPEPDFLSPNSTKIVLQRKTSNVSDVIDYKGSVPTGIMIYYKPGVTINGFSISMAPRNTLDTFRRLSYNGVIDSLGTLSINTNPRQKSVLYSSGPSQAKSVLNNVDMIGLDWLQLKPGLNSILANGPGPLTNYTLEYTTRYGAL